jgi:hypothetical protein
MIAKIATGEVEYAIADDGKNAAAIALGRVSGKARANVLNRDLRLQTTSPLMSLCFPVAPDGMRQGSIGAAW